MLVIGAHRKTEPELIIPTTGAPCLILATDNVSIGAVIAAPEVLANHWELRNQNFGEMLGIYAVPTQYSRGL